MTTKSLSLAPERRASSSGASLPFIVTKDAEAMSQQAAALIVQDARRRPDLLLCASAGSSPTRTYHLLGQAAASEPALFERLRVLKVDEWGGLPMDNPATCETDLRKNLLRPLRITPDRYDGFKSDAADLRRECERVAQWLDQNGPIDICLLGLGTNGHVAMNEPAEALCPHAHVARLAPTSLQHSMLAASAAKPTHGLTLGIGELLCSRKILLLVCGRHKSAVLKRLQEPTISTQFPASFLWLHPDATVLCDEEAAADLM